MRAFGSCTRLESLKIGNGVSFINDSAFSWCEYLSNVSYSGTSDPGDSSFDVFDGCPNLFAVEVPEDYEDNKFCGKDVSGRLQSSSSMISSLVISSSIVSSFVTSSSQSSGRDYSFPPDSQSASWLEENWWIILVVLIVIVVVVAVVVGCFKRSKKEYEPIQPGKTNYGGIGKPTEL